MTSKNTNNKDKLKDWDGWETVQRENGVVHRRKTEKLPDGGEVQYDIHQSTKGFMYGSALHCMDEDAPDETAFFDNRSIMLDFDVLLDDPDDDSAGTDFVILHPEKMPENSYFAEAVALEFDKRDIYDIADVLRVLKECAAFINDYRRMRAYHFKDGSYLIQDKKGGSFRHYRKRQEKSGTLSDTGTDASDNGSQRRGDD